MNNKKPEPDLTMLATKLGTADAEAFRALAAENNTTVSRMLSNYIKSVLTEDPVSERHPTGTNHATLTYQNVERLKHEVAFHNPKHLNPNEMLNEILERYFNLVDKARK